MKYTATFNEDGSISLDPDTPETRREASRFIQDFHAGRLQLVDDEPLPSDSAFVEGD